MEVALRTLARGERESAARIAVLGDMGELGESAREAHRDAGALAAQLGIDRLFAVGAARGRGGRRPRAPRAWTRRRCTPGATAEETARARARARSRRATACS